MPNRIVREGILDSDDVNKLTWQSECFYRRLMSIVDDYGLFDARIDLLRAKLFPLRLDRVSSSDVSKWMRECVEAGLVRYYEHEGKGYIEIVKFNQSVRIKKSRFPRPTDGLTQMKSNEIIYNHLPLETKRIRNESETEYEGEKKKNVRTNVLLSDLEIEKLKKAHTDDELSWMYDKLSAYKLSQGKRYKSDYGAILTWVTKSLKEEKEKISGKKEKKANSAENIISVNEEVKRMIENE